MNSLLLSCFQGLTTGVSDFRLQDSSKCYQFYFRVNRNIQAEQGMQCILYSKKLVQYLRCHIRLDVDAASTILTSSLYRLLYCLVRNNKSIHNATRRGQTLACVRCITCSLCQFSVLSSTHPGQATRY